MTSAIANTAGRDPVCGTTVDVMRAEFALIHGETAYYFCSAGCCDQFAADPAGWLARGPRPTSLSNVVVSETDRTELPRRSPEATPELSSVTPADELTVNGPEPPAVEWSCPMHLHVVRALPGRCPLCGMALERQAPMPVETDGNELRDVSRRFWVSAGFTVVLLEFILMDFFSVPALLGLSSPGALPNVEMILATPVCLWAAWPLYVKAAVSLRRGSPNVSTVIGVGVGLIYGYSVIAVLAPRLFQAAFQNASGRPPVYFGVGAATTTVVLLVQTLARRRRRRRA